MKENENATKIIHYCWFGPNKLSKLAKKCIASWKKYMPDYEIKLWNEDNFDFNQNEFVRQAYEQKKWAFVSDYARLKAISEFGGVYFDTDIEIVKDMSDILNQDCFMGIEDSNLVNAAVLGAKKAHNKFIDEMISIYDSHEKFDSEDIYKITIPSQITNKLLEYGLDKKCKKIQKLDNDSITVYPREYFYPLSYDHQNNIFTDNTYTIHHFDATWASTPEKITLFFRRHNMGAMVRVVDILVILKNIILNIVKDKAFWIFLLLTMTFLGIFVKLEYATDTYKIFSLPYMKIFKHFMMSGRFITGFFWYIISILNLGIYKSYIISFAIAIFCVALSMYKLYKIFIKDINNKILSAIIAMLIIMNVYLIEFFTFFEKGIMCFSILSSVLALDFLIKYFKDKKKKKLVISSVFLLLAAFSYQGSIAIFISIALVYIIKYSNNIKEFIKNNFITAGVYSVAGVINYIVVKFILPNERLSNGQENNIFASIKKVFEGLSGMIIDTYNILPKYFFIVSIIVVLFISIAIIFFNKGKTSKKVLHNLAIIYIIMGSFFASIFPQLMVNEDTIWLVGRSVYPFASIIGVLLLFICLNYKFKNKFIITIITILSTFYLCIVYVGYQNVARDRYTLNYIDNSICIQIQDKINEYENNTNNKINSVVFYTDKKIMYSYLDIETAYFDTNQKGFVPEWCRLGLLKLKLGRNLYEIKEKDPNIEKEFLENNWEFYNEKQVVFTDNTMHLCVF
ncbi:MAG: glucosyltransferase domain-containing protein [Clostridia bacterium]